nr:RagB/SusD family nutrient uptake outer membrane protein [uncultured Bacteroides sp.]
MKKKHIIIAALMGFALSACSDFLDREPITAPNNATFLATQDQVKTYINGLYTALPSLTTYGMSIRGEEKNSDNILAEKYDRRLNGEYQSFDASTEWQTGYKNLRNVNYFFNYYCVPEAAETDDVLSLKGEAFFLRAYWHFYLLTRFGDIPVMDSFWDENATVAGLQIPARKRSDVAKFILEDLTTAKGLLNERSKNSGLRISKEAALILAMRVALFEGSWEKYHKNTDFSTEDNSEYFFRQVINLGDELFQMNVALNTLETDATAKTKNDAFAHLFNQADLSSVSEAVFWKKYSIDAGVSHSILGLLGSGVVDNEGPAGLSKSLVDNFLNADGTFINPTDEKFKDFNLTFEGRDPRLTEMVMSTGAKFKSTTAPSRPMLVKEYSEEDKNDILPPYLKGDGQQRNVTGFHIRLGIDTTYVSGMSATPHILIRFAEALLSYAEAAEELGECTDAVLEKTLKPLRERVGVTYVKPSVIDPNFTDFGYTLTPNMQEIRRERRSELALQGYRLNDLLRWRAHKLICNQRGRGAYLGKDGILYKSFAESDQETINKVLVDGNGWMDPLQQYLPSGYLFNPERDYLLPIPPDELQLNKQLVQNPGGWN